MFLRFLGWTRRLAVLLVLIAMLAFNVLTFTVGALASAMTAFLGTMGLETVIDPDADRMLRAEVAELDRRVSASSAEIDDLRRREAAMLAQIDAGDRQLAAALTDIDGLRGERRAAQQANDLLRGQVDIISRRISTRTAEVAAANIGATAGESIPFYGVAIVVAATGYELWGACETMKDMRDLNVALGLATDDEDVTRVCGLRVPTTAEIWQAIRNSPSAVWTSATGAIGSAGAWVSGVEMPDLSMPDFGGWWEWALSWWSEEEEVAAE